MRMSKRPRANWARESVKAWEEGRPACSSGGGGGGVSMLFSVQSASDGNGSAYRNMSRAP